MACTYSSKFLPLIISKVTEFGQDELGLKAWFKQSFSDWENVYRRYVSGALYSESGASNPVKVTNKPYWGRFNPEITYDSASDYFKGATDLQIQSEQEFKKQIVKRLIFDISAENAEDRWKNPLFVNEETGISAVNEVIAQYKQDLANAILSEVGAEQIELTPDLSDSEFTRLIQDALAKYRQYLSTNPETAKHYNDFATLSVFDDYLATYAPFVTPKTEFVNGRTGKTIETDAFDKYTYHGPTVQHYTGYTSSEFAAIENQDSNLAKLLLDTIPDINDEGKPIPNSFIGLSGFNASMTAMKNWILYEADKEIRDMYYSGFEADVSEIIEAYLTRNKNVKDTIRNTYDDRTTFLTSKLKSIQKYIFDPDADLTIQSMFANMLFKTEPISYRTYAYDQEKKEIVGSNLRSSFINSQKFNVEDLVRSTAYLTKTSVSHKNNLRSRYEFSNVPNGIEIVDINNRNNRITVSLRKGDDKGVQGSFSGQVSEEFKRNLIKDLLMFVVPDTYVQIGQSIEGSDWNWFDDFAPFIGIIANIIKGKTNNAITFGPNSIVDLKNFTVATLKIAKKLSVIYGSETRNVVKNLSGSNLPLYQLTNLSYNLPLVIDDVLNDIQFEINAMNPDSIDFDENHRPRKIANENNLLVQARELLIAPQVRQEIQVGDIIKPATKLSVKELLQLNVLHDFYEGFSSEQTSPAYGKIYLQSATYADKSTHYLFGYDLNKNIRVNGENINLFEIIKNIIDGKTNSSRLMEITRTVRASRINNIVSNIIADYNDVFETQFTTIDEVSNFLKGKKYDDVVAAFKSKGVVFYDEYHGSKPKYEGAPNITLNETMLNYHKTFNDRALFAERIGKARNAFINSIDSNYWTWNKYDNSIFDKIYKDPKFKNFQDVNGNIKTHIGSQLHPILEAYFLTDVLLSNEINSLLIGEVFAHPNKNKRITLTQEEYDAKKAEDPNFDSEVGTYEEFSEANRLIAQIKRSVAFGATYHPYLQNLDNGVSPEIRIAVIEDIPGIVFTPNGDEKTDLDSSDGSGIAHPLQSRFENNSLVDARVGNNKKSIMMDVDQRYGKPTLLKWAVYELSNENRRNGTMSRANLENIYKKMSDGNLGEWFGYDELNNYIEDKNICYKDYKSGKYYKILDFDLTEENDLSNINGEYNITRNKIEINPDTGETFGTIISETISAKTLYDIDQALGGAWTGEFKNGVWEYNEAQLDVIEQYISENIANDEKQNLFIGYLVNKSAIKVGSGNINAVTSWNDSSALSTINMKTRYGGVQMDADHELDMAEVTEMTQMISALIEDGHYKDIVESIYNDIGGVVTSHVAKLNAAVQDVLNNGTVEAKQKLYEILAKSWIGAFENGSKDTIGIAQAFVKKASNAFKKGDFETRIPFSAATINGSFVSDVISSINKGGIRHKYEGFAGVLNPSHDMIEYYKVFNGDHWEVRMFDQFADFCRESLSESGINFDNIDTIYDNTLFNKNGGLNPLLKEVTHDNVDFEDTVVILDENNQPVLFNESNGDYYWYVNSFTTYDNLKSLLRAHPEYRTYVHTGKARNLKATNTKFTVNGVQYSIYDLDSVRASQYLTKALNDKKKRNIGVLTQQQINLIKRVLGWRFNIDDIKANPNVASSLIANAIKACNNKTQQILKNIEEGKSFEASEAFGITNSNQDENGIEIERDLLHSELSRLGPKKDVDVEDLVWQISQEVPSTESGFRKNVSNYIMQLIQGNILNPIPVGLSTSIVNDIKRAQNLRKKADKVNTEYVNFEKGTISDVAEAESNAQDALNEVIDRICDTVFDITPNYIVRKISNSEPKQSLTVTASDYKVEAAEMIAGRYQWEKFGLDNTTNVSDVTSSKYFYNRLFNRYNLPEYTESKLFDGILYGDNEQFLFKIGDVPTNDLVGTFSESTDFREIEGKIYYNGIKIGSSENKRFFTYVDEAGKKHHIIQLKTADDLREIRHSSLFDNVVRYNWTEDNLDVLKKARFNGDQAKIYTDDKKRPILIDSNLTTLAQLQTDEIIRFQKRISNQAKDMYDSFKTQLNYVGARIPTQAMQSFMAMNLIAVTNTKDNVVYVPKSQTYLEGSDYDIDKLYILAHSVNGNGLVQIGTPLQSKYGLDFVSKLSRPEGRPIEITDSAENATVLTQDFVERFEFEELDKSALLNLYNSALNTGRIYVTPYENDGMMSKRYYNRTVNKIVKEINSYSNSTLTSDSDPNYLKNRVVSGIWQITNKLQNQMVAQIPVDMGDPQAAAQQSTLGRAELHINSDDPSAKMMMQQQNAVGKEVIGISAVSLKGFFGLYYYYTELTDDLKQACIGGDPSIIIQAVDKLTFIHPITKEVTSLANIDIEQVIDVIRSNPEIKQIEIPLGEMPAKLISSSYYNKSNGKFNLLGFCKYLRDNVNLTDAALTDSALISAATDNAKELILAKINATPELVDIYTYLTSIGTPFLKIAEFMTSKSFGFITKAGEVDIFDSSSQHRKVKKAIDWFLGKDLLPGSDYMLLEQLFGLAVVDYNEDKVTHASKEMLIAALQNRTGVEQAINTLNKYLEKPIFNPDGSSTSWMFNHKELGTDRIPDEDIRNTIKILQWQLRAFDFKDSLGEDAVSEATKLENISDIITNVEEMSTMGQAQGINQGQRTNLYANRAFIKRIDDFVNKRFKDKEIDATFSFEKFVTDDVYRANMIDLYDKVKSTYNILEALTTLPHFWEMLKTTAISKGAIKQSSWRDRSIWDMADSIETLNNVWISEDDWKALDIYINDKIIAAFLRENDIHFKVPVGVNYYSGMSLEGKLQNKVDGYEISLNSVTGIASFKRLVEESIIPYLKSNFRYGSNAFVSNLIPYANVNFDRVITGWKLPLDMMNIDASPNTKLLFANILADFDAISNQTEFGMKLGDIFYLYNLVVNKDGYGRSSLTRLFENTINSDNTESLAYRFNEFVSKLDSGEIDLGLDQDEAVYRIKKSDPDFNAKTKLSSTFKVPSDFTLDLPKFFDLPIKSELSLDSIEMRKRTIDLGTSDAVFAIAQAIASKYDGSINIVTDDELTEESDAVRNAKAFIKDGMVYININSATAADTLHELSHLVLAAMKFSDDKMKRQTYYNLVASMRDKSIVPEERFNEITKAYIGNDGLITSDVLEEVLANEFASYLNGEIRPETPKLISTQVETAILGAIANVLELDKAPKLTDIQGKTLTEVMQALGKQILNTNSISRDFVTRTQKVSKMEDSLYKNKQLTCK